MITQKELKRLLDYNPLTGEFTWLVFRGGGAPQVGELAGWLNWQGYREIKTGRRIYQASRLAFLWMTGRWPKATIDHVNLDATDDRWINLREATAPNQMRNRRGWSRHGFKGVDADLRKGGFVARLKIGGRQIYLGRRRMAAEAHELYRAAAKKRFGAFARMDHRDN